MPNELQANKKGLSKQSIYLSISWNRNDILGIVC